MTKSKVTRRITLALALAALLVMLIGLVMVIQADSGPFDDGGPFAASSVAPTAGEVDVGDEVGFSLYVVNATTVTATEVLVWNPLPTGASYVSASGGAFPVVGGAVSDVALTAPPEGRAYDARLGTSVPLTVPGNVTGIAWVGNIPPEGMAVPGLIVTVHGPAGRHLVDEAFLYDDRDLAGVISGQTWVRLYSRYLPFVANRAEPPAPTTVITVPMVGLPVVMTSKGDTLAEAQAEPEWMLDSQSLYAAVHYPTDHHPFFSVARTYLQFDPAHLATISPTQVVAADLVLYPNGNWDECSAVDILFRVGTWDELDPAAWDDLGETLATFWATDTAHIPQYTAPIINFEALWAHQGKVAMLVDEATPVPPECMHLGNLSVGFFAFSQANNAPTHLLVTMRDE